MKNPETIDFATLENITGGCGACGGGNCGGGGAGGEEQAPGAGGNPGGSGNARAQRKTPRSPSQM